MMMRNGVAIARKINKNNKYHVQWIATPNQLLSPPLTNINNNYYASSYSFFSSKSHNYLDFTTIKQANDVVPFFHRMIRIKPMPSIVYFSKLLTLAVKMKHYHVALHMFDQMRQLGVLLDGFSLNILINCYCLFIRVDLGFAILGTLFKCGFVPNITTFTTLIRGLFIANKVQEAEILFKKLLREKLCQPDAITIGTVMNGLCKSGGVQTALNLLTLLERGSCKPNVYAYNSIIDTLCKQGTIDDACLLFSRMMQRGVTPDIVTYNSLIDGYCMRGEMEEARKVFSLFRQSGLKPSIFTYNSLMDGYCKKGDIDEARKVFMEIPRAGLEYNTVIYNTLLHGLLRVGRIADGWKFFNEMKVHHHATPNLVTYCSLIDGLCKNQQTVEAFSVLSIMEDDGVNPDISTYNSLIHGSCKAGKLDVAMDLFSSLPSKGLLPNIITFNIIILALCKEGSLDDAQDMFVRMGSRGCAPDSLTYNFFVQGCLKRNNIDKAKPILDEMLNKGISLDATTISFLLCYCREDCGDGDLKDLILKLIPKQKKIDYLISLSFFSLM